MVRIKYCCLLFVFYLAKDTVCYEIKLHTDITSSNETSYKTYLKGVELGIINMEKYSFESFQKDEQNMFRDLYLEYTSINEDHPLNYEEWLIMNNFGILPDTQEPLFQGNNTKRRTSDDKRSFVNTVKKGDILLTGRGFSALIGHAAIMTTDHWVLEMPGGAGDRDGMDSNNREISKHAWFDQYACDGITVYRCPDANVANEAAVWAHRVYYNPTGGEEKVKHIKYRITTDIWSTNPSYCSKLVIQAYYYGTGKKEVTRDLTVFGRIIVPLFIPSYFLNPYKLVSIGKY